MAKVKCPLFSFGATGVFGKIISYQKRPSGYACIEKSNPRDKKSDGEQRSRIINQLGKSKWKHLTQSQKNMWEDKAKDNNRGGYHEFISQWIRRYLSNKIPFVTPDEKLFYPQRIVCIQN